MNFDLLGWRFQDLILSMDLAFEQRIAKIFTFLLTKHVP